MELAPGWIRHSEGDIAPVVDMIDFESKSGRRCYNFPTGPTSGFTFDNVVAYRPHASDGGVGPVTLIEARKAMIALLSVGMSLTAEVYATTVADYLDQQVAVAAPVANDGWVAQGGPDFRYHNDDVLDVVFTNGDQVQFAHADKINWQNVVKFRHSTGRPLGVFDLSEIRRIASRVARSNVALPNHSARIVDYINQQVVIANVDAARHENDTLRSENAKLRKVLADTLSDRITRELSLVVTVAIQ